MPHWCWVDPVTGALLVLAKLAGWVNVESWPILIRAVILLAGAAFAAVDHAEILAVQTGEPFGSILLTLAITTLEVGPNISVMVAGEPRPVTATMQSTQSKYDPRSGRDYLTTRAADSLKTNAD
ncbi:hypothetical protein HPT29_025645 (plasmid) [Microvirga terrae]|uniref:Uncharacterized protein n=1 Tax=Microvirga terrae TaxID=2740529 RepID=A0ABY5S1Y3_9HYPH|nr:hypothetical protein [Microvirga terrae]UVF22534.1 hypothetical protein HPT29_025645 [Microvirga terrae]